MYKRKDTLKRNPKNKSAKDKFCDIQRKAKENITENEKVMDNQSVYISIWALVQIFVVFRLINDLPFLREYKIFLVFAVAAVISSLFALIFCIVVPTYSIHKRRNLLNYLEEVEGTYSYQDLEVLEEDALPSVKGRVQIYGLEKWRLGFLMLTLFCFAGLFVCIFCYYWYTNDMNDDENRFQGEYSRHILLRRTDKDFLPRGMDGHGGYSVDAVYSLRAEKGDDGGSNDLADTDDTETQDGVNFLDTETGGGGFGSDAHPGDELEGDEGENVHPSD